MEEMALLASVREHFLPYFLALEESNGRFFNFDHIPRLQVDPMNRILQLYMWDVALESHSFHAFHNLAILTDDDFLLDALEVCAHRHEFSAILALCARLERVISKPLLPYINCSESCGNCINIRSTLIKYLELKADWEFTRHKIGEARKKKLWMMRRPYMYFSPKTDAILKKIEKNNRKGWITVFSAVLIIRMWRQWMQRQVEPSSSFIKKISARWSKNDEISCRED